MSLLHIDASMRHADSISRTLAAELVAALSDQSTKVTHRDLAQGVPLINEAWIGANFTPADQRSAEQQQILAESDTLVNELKEAEVIVLATPVYNFHVPAALKAWVDLVARAKETFMYTDQGPVGLLKGKKVYVVLASGGVPLGSDSDFASTWLTHMLGFLGLTDVEFIDASATAFDPEAVLAKAKAQIQALAA